MYLATNFKPSARPTDPTENQNHTKSACVFNLAMNNYVTHLWMN